MQTADFRRFLLRPLQGDAVRHQGMAFFPRRLNGPRLMLGHQDRETIPLMRSDRPDRWHSSQVLLRPQEAWESMQLSTCGSPPETETGELVLTHGVGTMRKDGIGAGPLELLLVPPLEPPLEPTLEPPLPSPLKPTYP
ncbi:MAG: hypothetical protein RLZZ219_400 [Cyanobacteriota bacterium]|jgi:predicted GH43/DUF377 family glycosyl hydrolase